MVAFGVIGLFAIFGRFILDYLHITIEALQVSGGLLLLLVAMQLLTGAGEGEVAEAGATNTNLQGKRAAMAAKGELHAKADRRFDAAALAAVSRANGRERAHRATPVCSATIPPAKNRQRMSPKPASSISFAKPSGSGKRRTLAGRYE